MSKKDLEREKELGSWKRNLPVFATKIQFILAWLKHFVGGNKITNAIFLRKMFLWMILSVLSNHRVASFTFFQVHFATQVTHINVETVLWASKNKEVKWLLCKRIHSSQIREKEIEFVYCMHQRKNLSNREKKKKKLHSNRIVACFVVKFVWNQEVQRKTKDRKKAQYNWNRKEKK